MNCSNSFYRFRVASYRESSCLHVFWNSHCKSLHAGVIWLRLYQNSQSINSSQHFWVTEIHEAIVCSERYLHRSFFFSDSRMSLFLIISFTRLDHQTSPSNLLLTHVLVVIRNVTIDATNSFSCQISVTACWLFKH